jgi:hypothetical protein
MILCKRIKRDIQFRSGDGNADSNNKSAITRFYTFWVPMKKKMVWPEGITTGPPSAGPVKERCAIVGWAYQNTETDETDHIIHITNVTVDLYYKDP